MAPFDLGAGEGFVAADAVDLEGDEAFGGEGVFEVGAGDAVEPGFDGISMALDPHLVPLVWLVDFLAGFGKGILGCFVIATAQTGVKPTAPALVINTRTPHPVRFIGVNLHLIAVDPARGKLLGFTVFQCFGDFLVIGVGTNLDAGIEAIVALIFVFQHKIAVMLLGAQE